MGSKISPSVITVLHTQVSTERSAQQSRAEQLWPQLNTCDQARASSMASAKRRHDFVVGRALLVTGLKQLTGNGDYQFDYNALGKPLLVSPAFWQVNLSHSGNHFYAVFAQHIPCGIDTEVIKQRGYERLMKTVFTEAEQQSIIKSDNPLQAFYCLWTQKEAQVKQQGKSVFSTPNCQAAYLKTYQYADTIFSVGLDCRAKDIMLSSEFWEADLFTQSLQPFMPKVIQ